METKSLLKNSKVTQKYNRFNSLKVLTHSDKLQELAKGNICNPEQWIIYPSNKCCYDCSHCIMREYKKNGEMLSDDAMKRIAPSVSHMNIKTVIFSGGGEPLIHPKTLEICKELQNRNIKVGMNTNGYLLEETMPVDYLRISVDAATRETYKEVHNYDGWDKLNDNLSRLKRTGELGLAFLITPLNFLEIEMFCEWAQQYDPDFIHIRPAYLKESNNEMKGLMESISYFADDISVEYENVFIRTDKFDGFWNERFYSKCRATPLIAVTGADGAFIPCQDVFMKFGDFNKQSFSDIWNSQEHMDTINSIKLNECPRCVMNQYNEIIEQCFINDGLRMFIL